MLHFDMPAAANLSPSWLEIFSIDPFLVAGAINGEEGKDGPAKWFCMVGYPEALTDPSYKGQILVLTTPMVRECIAVMFSSPTYPHPHHT